MQRLDLRSDCIFVATVAIAVALAASCMDYAWGQEPLVAQRQVTFLTADSAEVTTTDDGKVRIFAEGLTDDRGYGVIVTPEGPSNWIEASKPGLFPPAIVEQMESQPGSYLLEGQPGDSFQLRIDRSPERPLFDTATIDGEPDEPDPPPVSYKQIEILSRVKSAELNDPANQAAIKAAITSVVATLQPAMTVGEASGKVNAAITAALSDAAAAGRWEAGWRIPLSEAGTKLKVDTTSEYISFISAAARGL